MSSIYRKDRVLAYEKNIYKSICRFVRFCVAKMREKLEKSSESLMNMSIKLCFVSIRVCFLFRLFLHDDTKMENKFIRIGLVVTLIENGWKGGIGNVAPTVLTSVFVCSRRNLI